MRDTSISASGAESVDNAKHQLAEQVCLKLGDGEPYFELTPPLHPHYKQSYVALSGNSGWSVPTSFTRRDFASLYEGGLCSTCCSGIGRRTVVPLPVGSLGKAELLAARADFTQSFKIKLTTFGGRNESPTSTTKSATTILPPRLNCPQILYRPALGNSV